MNESVASRGVVEVCLIDQDGHIVSTFYNRLTNYALAAAARLWVGEYVKTPDRIMLGTGTPPPPQTGPLATDDTLPYGLWTPDPTTLREVDLKTTFLTVYSEFGVTYQTNEINDVEYTEASLMDEDGNVWAHVVLSLYKRTEEPQTAVVLWKIHHQQLS